MAFPPVAAAQKPLARLGEALLWRQGDSEAPRPRGRRILGTVVGNHHPVSPALERCSFPSPGGTRTEPKGLGVAPDHVAPDPRTRSFPVPETVQGKRGPLGSFALRAPAFCPPRSPGGDVCSFPFEIGNPGLMVRTQGYREFTAELRNSRIWNGRLCLMGCFISHGVELEAHSVEAP